MKNVIQGKAMWAKVYDPDTKFDPNGIYSSLCPSSRRRSSRNV